MTQPFSSSPAVTKNTDIEDSKRLAGGSIGELIDAVTDPRISFFLNLRGNHPSLERESKILIEGEQQVERFLKSDLPFEAAFFEQRFAERFVLEFPRRFNPSIKIYVADRKLISQIVGYRLHQGCMLLAPHPQWADFSELKYPIIALNQISDPENVGSMVRSAAGFGIPSLLVDKGSGSPFLRRAIRVSMGGIFNIKVAYTESLQSTLTDAKQNRIPIFGIDSGIGAKPIPDAEEFASIHSSIVVFGNERSGIQREILKLCDDVYEIPMARTDINSLNVSVAAGIIFHHFFQRQLRRGK